MGDRYQSAFEGLFDLDNAGISKAEEIMADALFKLEMGIGVREAQALSKAMVMAFLKTADEHEAPSRLVMIAAGIMVERLAIICANTPAAIVEFGHSLVQKGVAMCIESGEPLPDYCIFAGGDNDKPTIN